jgi:uncharacterized protein (DUF2267 family)
MSDGYERFLDLVQQRAHRSREDAELAARATLRTLAERISPGQARDLAEQLPPELAPWIATTGDAEAFDVDEFLRRVAEREGSDVARAERDARAVFAALGRCVGRRKEIDDLASELPRSFGPLLDEAQGRFVHVMSADTFLAKVADRAGLDPAGARRAADAVLETLAERIAGGEVRHLITQLPVELHAPLKRGDAQSHGAARRMSAAEFVLHVAEREGVTPGEALRHARAVFATLREAVPEQEFLDVTAQLPSDFAAVEARP